MNGRPDADRLPLPVVTVLGAGIAGLTAAHELVERGFKVQIVEPQESDFEEYQCAVGGLAANQFSRVRAPVEELHPDLRDPSAVRKWRDDTGLEPTRQRFPILQRIRFNKRIHGPQPPRDLPDYDAVPPTPFEPAGDIPQDWQDYWDEHGTLNRRKLDDVQATIREAARHYMAHYFPRLQERIALETAPTEQEWLNQPCLPIKDDPALVQAFVAREILLVRVIGYTDSDGTSEDNRRLGRFMGDQGPRRACSAK